MIFTICGDDRKKKKKKKKNKKKNASGVAISYKKKKSQKRPCGLHATCPLRKKGFLQKLLLLWAGD